MLFFKGRLFQSDSLSNLVRVRERSPMVAKEAGFFFVPSVPAPPMPTVP